MNEMALNRDLCIAAAKRGIAQKTIADVLGVSVRTVRRACTQKKRQNKKEPSTDIKNRRAKVKQLARSRCRRGHLLFPTYPSARDIQRQLLKVGISCSRRTVIRDLRAIGGRSYVRPKVPTRRPQDFVARKNYALKYSKEKNISKRLVFTDESLVVACETTGRQMWVFPGEEPIPRESKSRYNVPSLMVWAAIGHNYKSELIIFPSFSYDDSLANGKKGFRLDKHGYIRRCLSKIVPSLANSNKILVQDGARCHQNEQVLSYLQRKKVRVVECWPAHSPDCNMIECCWSLLKERVGRLVPESVDDLRAKLREAWDSISQQEINQLVARYDKKLKNLIASNGQSTKAAKLRKMARKA